MSKIEDAIAILESLKRTEHEVDDDPWNSCPKTDDCTNIEYRDIPISERPCECGMDELNEGLESAIAILRSVQQKPAMKYDSEQRPINANHMSIDRNGNIAPSMAKRNSNPPASQSPLPQADSLPDRAEP